MMRLLNKIFSFNSIWILCSTLLFCTSAFYNKFPYTFNADTAMYMDAVSHGQVGPDRPILYGLFMKYSSLGISLWAVIFIQSLFISKILFCYFSGLMANNENLSRKRMITFYLAFSATASFFMGGSFTANWLMPDVFTPLLVLAIGLLLFYKSDIIDTVVISSVAVISSAMHNSNPYISFIILIVVTLIWLINKKVHRINSSEHIRGSRIAFCILLIIISQILLAIVHYNYGGGFKSSKGGAVFLMGSFVEMGIVKKYLDENCEKKTYFICSYKDSLPENFLWNPKSPIYKNGGWNNNEKEYKVIIKDILTTPKYLKLALQGSLKFTVRQFFRYGTGEAYAPWVRVSKAINDNYPQDYIGYDNSLQRKRVLNFEFLNVSQTILFALSLLIYSVLLLNSSITSNYRFLIIYILITLIINAWFCATFSGVFHRYQSRVVWLTPLPLFLLAMNTDVLKRISEKLRLTK